MSATAARHDRRDIPDELELQKLEEAMAADLRQLDRDMTDFDGSLQRAEQRIEQQWRRAHLGHGPNRPWAWQTRQGRRGAKMRDRRRREHT